MPEPIKPFTMPATQALTTIEKWARTNGGKGEIRWNHGTMVLMNKGAASGDSVNRTAVLGRIEALLTSVHGARHAHAVMQACGHLSATAQRQTVTAQDVSKILNESNRQMIRPSLSQPDDKALDWHFNPLIGHSGDRGTGAPSGLATPERSVRESGNAAGTPPSQTGAHSPARATEPPRTQPPAPQMATRPLAPRSWKEAMWVALKDLGAHDSQRAAFGKAFDAHLKNQTDPRAGDLNDAFKALRTTFTSGTNAFEREVDFIEGAARDERVKLQGTPAPAHAMPADAQATSGVRVKMDTPQIWPGKKKV